QIHASSNITMNGQNYILPVNEDGQIQVVLNDEELDESKLSYTVDDSNIASVSGSGSTCQIYGKNAGGTNIRILYDGKEIKTIYLEVEGEEDVDDSQQSSLDSNSEVDLVVKGYLENYADAVNYGEISYVEPYLTSTGAFHKELSKAIPKRYEKGTQVDVIGYTKNSMKQESGQYRVGMTIEYYVYKEGETKYQKEYMEFIAVQRSGEWLIDKYENWKLLEQYKV
ncbi:MAG: TcaA NTF2-like domain-containing protein, partial [Intestinibacter sp.]|uniref:TcaA NTF2-like domain-containing protein n=1 Tax=Intestinibacter sp. TaxID=1965304 RepID=UPI003F15C519